MLFRRVIAFASIAVQVASISPSIAAAQPPTRAAVAQAVDAERPARVQAVDTERPPRHTRSHHPLADDSTTRNAGTVFTLLGGAGLVAALVLAIEAIDATHGVFLSLGGSRPQGWAELSAGAAVAGGVGLACLVAGLALLALPADGSRSRAALSIAPTDGGAIAFALGSF